MLLIYNFEVRQKDNISVVCVKKSCEKCWLGGLKSSNRMAK